MIEQIWAYAFIALVPMAGFLFLAGAIVRSKQLMDEAVWLFVLGVMFIPIIIFAAVWLPTIGLLWLYDRVKGAS